MANSEVAASECLFHQIIVTTGSIGLGIGRAQVTMAIRSGTMHNGTKVHGGDEFSVTRLAAALTVC